MQCFIMRCNVSKLLYFDVETTGLDPVKNDIIQIAGMIVIDGKVEETFNFNISPFPDNVSYVSQEALDVHGYTLEQILTFPDPIIIYRELIDLFAKYINKYDKTDKFTPAGYNVRFDMEFLKQFFVKNCDVYFGSWVNWKMIDPLPILHYLDFCGMISLPDYKLVTVCNYFGIEIQAHDALSDIVATRNVIQILTKNFLNKNNAQNSNK